MGQEAAVVHIPSHGLFLNARWWLPVFIAHTVDADSSVNWRRQLCMMLQAKQHPTPYVASPTLGGTPSPPGGCMGCIQALLKLPVSDLVYIQTAAVQPLPI